MSDFSVLSAERQLPLLSSTNIASKRSVVFSLQRTTIMKIWFCLLNLEKQLEKRSIGG